MSAELGDFFGEALLMPPRILGYCATGVPTAWRKAIFSLGGAKEKKTPLLHSATLVRF
jgi:hypothetical protein